MSDRAGVPASEGGNEAHDCAICERLRDAIVAVKDYETRTRPHLILNDDGEFMWVDDLMVGDFVIWTDEAMLDG